LVYLRNKMRNLSLIAVSLFLVVSVKTKAQVHIMPQGANSIGMGNASVTNSNAWSVFNNAANLTDIKDINGAFSFDMFQQMPSIKTLSFVATLPALKDGTAGFKLFRSGNEIYNEQVAGIALGHKIGNVSLGLNADYLQVNIQNFATKSTLIISFGGKVQLSKTLFLGAHVYNMNLAKMSAYQDERVPTIMKGGLSYRPFEKLMVSAEVVKDIYAKPDIRAGLEYKIIENLPIRVGINTLTNAFFTGLGVRVKDFELDYAIATRQVYGATHTITLNYKLRRNKTNQITKEVEEE
jgi:hypothetical protein